MRIDVVSIFPAYLDALALSLPGKARESGLLDVHVHDLRQWAHDRHRTVDDAPYGGGAGMVMRPEPWGEALDELGVEGEGTVLVVPTPSGRPFTQPLAAELAGADRLVFACGRYEGIDERVLEHARSRVRVLEVSLGDYVLNGGEVAALAVIEAVVRLLPGFMGNAQSLVEESHNDGLLEYPVYTRPPSWRGLEVPDALLSGDHARVTAWRHDQALRRTSLRRPDLLHPAATLSVEGVGEAEWRLADPSDAGELFTLQRACWALRGQDLPLPAALSETVADVTHSLEGWTTFVLRAGDRLVGSVRGRLDDTPVGAEWSLDRLMVAPDLQRRGLGRWLLGRAEEAAPPQAARFGLSVPRRDEDGSRLFRRAGYRAAREQPDPSTVRQSKRRRR